MTRRRLLLCATVCAAPLVCVRPVLAQAKASSAQGGSYGTGATTTPPVSAPAVPNSVYIPGTEFQLDLNSQAVLARMTSWNQQMEQYSRLRQTSSPNGCWHGIATECSLQPVDQGYLDAWENAAAEQSRRIAERRAQMLRELYGTSERDEERSRAERARRRAMLDSLSDLRDAMDARARSLEQSGQLAEAERVLQAAIVATQDADAYSEYARFLRRHERPAEALDVIETGLRNGRGPIHDLIGAHSLTLDAVTSQSSPERRIARQDAAQRMYLDYARRAASGELGQRDPITGEMKPYPPTEVTQIFLRGIDPSPKTGEWPKNLDLCTQGLAYAERVGSAFAQNFRDCIAEERQRPASGLVNGSWHGTPSRGEWVPGRREVAATAPTPPTSGQAETRPPANCSRWETATGSVDSSGPSTTLLPKLNSLWAEVKDGYLILQNRGRYPAFYSHDAGQVSTMELPPGETHRSFIAEYRRASDRRPLVVHLTARTCGQ